MITINQYLKLENENITIQAFNLCLLDFKRRGVGYCKLKGLTFTLNLTTDLKKLHFKIYLNNTFQNSLRATIKPTKELINKYKEEFL